ncbi:hypothetical protein NQ176_g4817 [Zarea fungicola]|uniref:Uncharacterized protein n=1 Tax=Zarea fungicola TaxID=93591 RepID=A0ACC1NCB2_9HYPO|nr:hypothetical protein NQ176_g4817 [Lecanicillium fungicola]
MSRTRKAPSPEDTDTKDLVAAVSKIIGRGAEKRRKCVQDIQDIQDKCQEIMNRVDDSDEFMTDQETAVLDCVTEFFADARHCKASQRHSREQGRRLLAQCVSETSDASATKKIPPGPDIAREPPREDDDASASSSDFPELDFKNDSTVHVRTARRHDTVNEEAGPSVQLDTGGNSVQSQLDGELQRKPTKTISRAGQNESKEDPPNELEQLNKSKRRAVTMSEYAAQFSDRKVIPHRSKYWILHCEVHSGQRFTKKSGMDHLTLEHQKKKQSFDETLGYLGIEITDYIESTAPHFGDRASSAVRQSQEVGGRRSNTREPRTESSPSALPITKGRQAEHAAAADTMEQAARPVPLQQEQPAVNGRLAANSNDDLQHGKEGALHHTERSISVAVATRPMPKVVQEPLRSNTASLVSETALHGHESRERPLDLSSPNIQKALDRPEKDSLKDNVNNTIVIRGIEQRSGAPSKGSTGARDETPYRVRGGGRGSLRPRPRQLQESPNKRGKPGVKGVPVSRSLTRPRNDEPEEVSSPSPSSESVKVSEELTRPRNDEPEEVSSPNTENVKVSEELTRPRTDEPGKVSSPSTANRGFREPGSQPPPELGLHVDVLNMSQQSRISAMIYGSEKPGLATTTMAAATQPPVVAAPPLCNSPATGPLELSEGQMFGLQEMINNSELAVLHCPRCGSVFFLQYCLEEHLEHCDGQAK